MDFSTAAVLTQDGITNGAIYALLTLAIVLVFSVTRVIFIPQGEFVAFGALTLASLQAGVAPATIWLLAVMALLTTFLEIGTAVRLNRRKNIIKTLGFNLALPGAIVIFVWVVAPMKLPLPMLIFMTLAIISPMGPMIYRLGYQRLASASVLVLLIVSIGMHFVLLGLGLYFFGAEGSRAEPYLDIDLTLAGISVTGQSVVVIMVSTLLIVALALFFARTLYGKALRATSLNRVGARLMGVSTTFAGKLSFFLAALIGALSGILILPITTIYYDSGFLIGLKGFVGAIFGGLSSYPIGAVGAMFVGALESYSSFWASALKEVIVFTSIIPVLLWRSISNPHQGREE